MNDNNKKLLKIIAKLTLIFGYISEAFMTVNTLVLYAFPAVYDNVVYNTVIKVLILTSIGLLLCVFSIALIMLIQKKYDREPSYDRDFRLQFELHTNDIVSTMCTVFLPIMVWAKEHDGSERNCTTAAVTLICQWLILLLFFYYDAYLEQFDTDKNGKRKPKNIFI